MEYKLGPFMKGTVYFLDLSQSFNLQTPHCKLVMANVQILAFLVFLLISDGSTTLNEINQSLRFSCRLRCVSILIENNLKTLFNLFSIPTTLPMCTVRTD